MALLLYEYYGELAGFSTSGEVQPRAGFIGLLLKLSISAHGELFKSALGYSFFVFFDRCHVILNSFLAFWCVNVLPPILYSSCLRNQVVVQRILDSFDWKWWRGMRQGY